MSETSSIHPVELDIDDLLRSCHVQQTRGSGPGGQHRNKVATAIVITHQPSGVSGQASERRSQLENRQQAIQRLRIQLALAIRIERGSAVEFRPPPIWTSRIKSGRIEISAAHADFPVLLAIALDLLADNDVEARTVASGLGCSTTQLIRFLGKEPAALAWLNEQRTDRGKSRYRLA